MFNRNQPKIYKITHKILGDLMVYPSEDGSEDGWTCKFIYDIHPEERFQVVPAMFELQEAKAWISNVETQGYHVNDGPFKGRLKINPYWLN